ncbi:MAG TPA: YwqG family protein [Candidatus Melainabacteria bacterium]|nr:YwqG family protein [Candidatus Melainabacteria bacterium]HMP52877.1 YwqG family protein [Candidatus Melainabacteria bacterium]
MTMSFNDEAIQHFIDKQDLQGLIRFFGLGEFEAAIKEQALESKRLRVEPDAKERGSSHFGGVPDLPADFLWPRRQDGRPLSALARLDLCEISFWAERNHLPPEGVLTVFYDLGEQPRGFQSGDKDGLRVYFHDRDINLVPTIAPLNLNERLVLPASKIRFEDELTFPDFKDCLAENLTFAGTEPYKAFLNSWYQQSASQSGCHRLLGYPQLLEGDVREECALASDGTYESDLDGRAMDRAREIASEATSWVLLMQIDREPECGIEWSDQGMLYIMIERDHLLERKFDNSWAMIQGQ